MYAAPATKGEQSKRNSAVFQDRTHTLADTRKEIIQEKQTEEMKKSGIEVSASEFMKYRSKLDDKSKSNSFHNGSVQDHCSQKLNDHNSFDRKKVMQSSLEMKEWGNAESDILKGNRGGDGKQMFKSSSQFTSSNNFNNENKYQANRGSEHNPRRSNSNNQRNAIDTTKSMVIEVENNDGRISTSKDSNAQISFQYNSTQDQNSFQSMSFGVEQQQFLHKTIIGFNKLGDQQQQQQISQLESKQEQSRLQQQSSFTNSSKCEFPPKVPKMKIGVKQDANQNKSFNSTSQEQCKTARTRSVKQEDSLLIENAPLQSERMNREKGIQKQVSEKNIYQVHHQDINNNPTSIRNVEGPQIIQSQQRDNNRSLTNLAQNNQRANKSTSIDGFKNDIQEQINQPQKQRERVMSSHFTSGQQNYPNNKEMLKTSSTFQNLKKEQQPLSSQQEQQISNAQNQNQTKQLSTSIKRSLVLPQEENTQRESVIQLKSMNDKLKKQIDLLQSENASLISSNTSLQIEIKSIQANQHLTLNQYMQSQQLISSLQEQLTCLKNQQHQQQMLPQNKNKQQISLSEDCQSPPQQQQPHIKQKLWQLEDYHPLKSDIFSTTGISSKSTSSAKLQNQSKVSANESKLHLNTRSTNQENLTTQQKTIINNEGQQPLIEQTFSQGGFDEAVQSIKGEDKTNQAAFDLLYQVFQLVGDYEGERIEDVLQLPDKVQALINESKQSQKFKQSMKDLMNKFAEGHQYLEKCVPNLKQIWKFIEKIMEQYSVLKSKLLLQNSKAQDDYKCNKYQSNSHQELKSTLDKIYQCLQIDNSSLIIPTLQQLTMSHSINQQCCQMISSMSKSHSSPQQVLIQIGELLATSLLC